MSILQIPKRSSCLHADEATICELSGHYQSLADKRVCLIVIDVSIAVTTHLL